jgi:heat-inducible transcriptional repressor
MRFIPTGPGELLAVVVFTDGTVENRYVSVETTPTASQLERLHNVLEEVVEGRTLAVVREKIAAGLDERRDELVALRELGLALVDDAVRQIELGAEIIVEGQERLLANPDLKSADHVRTLVRALDDRERLISLIDRTLASTRVQVFFGEEVSGSAYPMTLVAAPYHETEGRPGGVLGVLGPTRMNYPMVLPLVSAAAEAVSAALSRHRESAVRPTGRSRSEDPDPEDPE